MIWLVEKILHILKMNKKLNGIKKPKETNFLIWCLFILHLFCCYAKLK